MDVVRDATPPQPKTDDADVTVYFKTALAVLYYIGYPFYRLAYVVYLLLLQVLKPIWSVIRFVTLPFTYLAAFCGYLLSLPIRMIAKLETIYIFLGIAVLIGLGTGLLLAIISFFTSSTLRLDAPQPPKRKHLRTLSKFRKTRERRRAAEVPPPLPSRASTGIAPLSASPISRLLTSGTAVQGGLSKTIEDEDYSE